MYCTIYVKLNKNTIFVVSSDIIAKKMESKPKKIKKQKFLTNF